MGTVMVGRRRVRDDLGTPVVLERRPRRVVSLVPSLTEAISATVPDVLVGATQWCSRPAGLDVIRVRGTKSPDLMLIKHLSPDVVVANQEENRELDVARLRALGVPVWVTRIESVDEAFSSLRRLFGEVLGRPAPDWLDTAEAVWAEPPRHGGLRVAVPVWRDPWIWVGSGTYTDDLLRRLGCSNVGAALGSRYPREPVQAALAASPDVLLLPDEPYPFSSSDGPEAVPTVPTALVPGRSLFWYGPAMVDARRIIDSALASKPGLSPLAGGPGTERRRQPVRSRDRAVDDHHPRRR